MMIPRQCGKLIGKALGDYPAVALIGPRQCGKTTLAKSLGGLYFDLEQDGEAVRLDAQWGALMPQGELLILDEAQSRPEVFRRLRGAIDSERDRNGRFLLLGSVSPLLMTRVAESLAGRLSIVELSPFLLGEVGAARLDDLWLYGGYPDGGILNAGRFPRWQDDYLQLLAMRDLPQWGLPARPQLTLRLMKMLAAVQAQSWNASRLASGLGIDYKTLNSYLDCLEGAFLVRRLPPFLPNISKRLMKAPKVFWRDSGLIHAMLGARSSDHLLTQPWVGASWEGFVIDQTLAALAASGRLFRAYSFRTSDQYELDLVLEIDAEVWAVEIKLTSDPSPGDIQRLQKTADMVGASFRALVCRVGAGIRGDRLLVTDAPGWLAHLGA